MVKDGVIVTVFCMVMKGTDWMREWNTSKTHLIKHDTAVSICQQITEHPRESAATVIAALISAASHSNWQMTSLRWVGGGKLACAVVLYTPDQNFKSSCKMSRIGTKWEKKIQECEKKKKTEQAIYWKQQLQWNRLFIKRLRPQLKKISDP